MLEDEYDKREQQRVPGDASKKVDRLVDARVQLAVARDAEVVAEVLILLMRLALHMQRTYLRTRIGGTHAPTSAGNVDRT